MIATDYGVFGPLVSTAGTIIAMGTALTLGFKGRAKWEPVEEDVPSAPQKVASLVAALMCVVILVRWNDIQYRDRLTHIVIDCSITLIASLLVYGFLKGVIYTAVLKRNGSPANSKAPKEIKVIGGLWLKTTARNRKDTFESPQEPGQPPPRILTVQRMFGLSGYHKDELWSRPSQQLASMLFTIGYLGLMIAGTVGLGSAAILAGAAIKGAAIRGAAIREDSGPMPIVLMGSSNVRSHLWERIPDVIRPMKPLWLDLGSGAAQKDLFYAFDYGGLAYLGSKRTGLLALSSDGSLTKLTKTFHEAKPIKGGDNDQTRNNYWLSIKIGRFPLAMLYREGTGAVIPRVEFSNRFPPEGSIQSDENRYGFIRFANLRNFIEKRSKSVGKTIRHLPEMDTGTRLALDRASSTKIKRIENDIGHPVSFLEALGDNKSDPFVLIVSDAPLSTTEDKPADCGQLEHRGIKTAVVCRDGKKCDGAVTVEFAIVVKVIPQHDALNTYQIGNQAECRIAEALTPKVSSCKVEGIGPNDEHIIEVTAYTPSKSLPTYLACPVTAEGTKP